jgi:hypothetical protein
MSADEDGLACPLLLPGAHNYSDKGHGALPGFALSHRVRMVGDALLVRNPRLRMLVEVLTA